MLRYYLATRRTTLTPPEFKEQMKFLVHEYKGDGKYLSLHHPDMPEALDDALNAMALILMCAARGAMGDISSLRGRNCR